VKDGQVARVAADAYPGEAFDATIFFISPAVDLTRGTVEVKLKPAALPPFLRNDMTVSAEIVVDRRDAALVVPTTAVRDPRGRDPWVAVIEGRKQVRRPVKVGITGTGDTEIVSGLVEGQRVVVPKGGGASADDEIPLGPR
jgi:HlyD family secretion protein